MKKLRLEVEQLAVESFVVTSGAVWARGTVEGRVTSPAPVTCRKTDCDQNTCAETCQNCVGTLWVSCGASCGGSCDVSCQATCGTCPTEGEATCFSCEGTCPPACTLGLPAC